MRMARFRWHGNAGEGLGPDDGCSVGPAGRQNAKTVWVQVRNHRTGQATWIKRHRVKHQVRMSE